MEWSKIKNIVLLILVCVNAFLLALVLLQQHKTAQFQEEASAGAVSALANSGIAFHLERVPRDMELAGLNFTQDRSGEQAAAEALLGRVTEQAESTTMRTLPGGADLAGRQPGPAAGAAPGRERAPGGYRGPAHHGDRAGALFGRTQRGKLCVQ